MDPCLVFGLGSMLASEILWHMLHHRTMPFRIDYGFRVFGMGIYCAWYCAQIYFTIIYSKRKRLKREREGARERRADPRPTGRTDPRLGRSRAVSARRERNSVPISTQASRLSAIRSCHIRNTRRTDGSKSDTTRHFALFVRRARSAIGGFPHPGLHGGKNPGSWRRVARCAAVRSGAVNCDKLVSAFSRLSHTPPFAQSPHSTYKAVRPVIRPVRVERVSDTALVSRPASLRGTQP